MKFVILVLALAPLLAAFGVAALGVNTRRAGRFEIIGVLLMLLLVGAIVTLRCEIIAARGCLARDLAERGFPGRLSGPGFPGHCPPSSGRVAGSRVLFGGCLLVLFWLDFVTHMPTQNPGAKPSVYAPGWARAQFTLHPEPRLGGSRVMLSPAALEFLRYNPMAGLEETYCTQPVGASGELQLAGRGAPG